MRKKLFFNLSVMEIQYMIPKETKLRISNETKCNIRLCTILNELMSVFSFHFLLFFFLCFRFLLSFFFFFLRDLVRLHRLNDKYINFHFDLSFILTSITLQHPTFLLLVVTLFFSKHN